LARTIRRLLVLPALAGLALALGSDAALAVSAEDGKAIFEQKCTSCHTIGGGQLVGPDLQGVLDRLGSTDAIVQFMLDPAGVRPGTAMPNLGLSADEAASLAAFLGGGEAAPADTTTQPAETAPTETQAAPAGPGGTASGKNLFTGADRTLAIGAGQMSRVDAVRVARMKAESLGAAGLRGSVAASDAFFPFRDGLDAVAAAGATAVVQPGGSVRDPEVIAAADEQGLAMVFTGRRHFRH